jgi:hypothetical protein
MMLECRLGSVLVAMLVVVASASTTLPRSPLRLSTPAPLDLSLIGMAPSASARRPNPDRHANIGKAIDALQSDYPSMLALEPRLDIFTDDVQLIDAHTGMRIAGKQAYARTLSLLRWTAGACLDHAETGVWLVYDPIASQIRARWSAKLFPRGQAGFEPPIHVDGVSLYSLDEHGVIFKHELRSDVPLSHHLSMLSHAPAALTHNPMASALSHSQVLACNPMASGSDLQCADGLAVPARLFASSFARLAPTPS